MAHARAKYVHDTNTFRPSTNKTGESESFENLYNEIGISNSKVARILISYYPALKAQLGKKSIEKRYIKCRAQIQI